MTQAAAAAHIGCSRPTFIAIEKGTRVAKPDEIIALATLFGRSVNELVRKGEPTGDQPVLHVRSLLETEVGLRSL